MKVKNTCVIGVGTMGTGIGQSLALAGYEVWMHDLAEDALRKSTETIEHGRFGLRQGIQRGKVTEEQAESALQRLHPTTDLAEALDGVDFAIEVVYEDFGLKIRTFRQLDGLLPAHAILASNTSGFSITALAAATDRPDKVLGWHWSSPSAIMRLAEIVVHDQTSADTRQTVVEMASRCDKNPQVVKDQPTFWGFVGNRVLIAMLREAEQIVREGIATTEQVDAILKDEFRWPAGPFEIAGGPAARSWE